MEEKKVYEEFLKGEIDAFYRHRYSAMVLYASRQLGDDMAFLAEDCVQEAIFKTYKQRKTFVSPSALKAYLYACIHNNAISHLRKQQAKDNYTAESDDEAVFERGLIEQETIELLFDAIGRLSERYRRIFELSFERGMKNAEVAAILGVSESAVKKQKYALISTLREDLLKHTDSDFVVFLLLLVV